MYNYYQTICKQLSECVNKENQCEKRVFSLRFQWLAVTRGKSKSDNVNKFSNMKNPDNM